MAGKENSVYASSLAPLVKGLIDEVIEYAGIGVSPTELIRKPLDGRKFDLIIDSQKYFGPHFHYGEYLTKDLSRLLASFFCLQKNHPVDINYPNQCNVNCLIY